MEKSLLVIKFIPLFIIKIVWNRSINIITKLDMIYVMKKPLLLFLVSVALLMIAKLAYDKYCESKKEGCKKERLEDSHLSDDHMDN